MRAIFESQPRPLKDMNLPEFFDEVHASESHIRNELQRMDKGAATGLDQWTPFLLLKAVDNPAAMEGLSIFMHAFLRGNLPEDVMETLMTARLVPIPKKGGFRPIAIATLFYKLAARLVTSGLDSRLRDYFLPIQHGAGAVSAATDVCRTKLQRALENPNHVAISCDLVGAFDNLDRAYLWETIVSLAESKRYLRPMLPFIRAAYSKPTRLLLRSGGTAFVLWTMKGVRQGCPMSMLLFCLVIQPILELIETLFPGVKVIAYADDIFLIGPPNKVFPARTKLGSLLGRRAGLSFQPAKARYAYFGNIPEVMAELRAHLDLIDPDATVHVTLMPVLGSFVYSTVEERKSETLTALKAEVMKMAVEAGASVARAFRRDRGVGVIAKLTMLRQCAAPGMMHIARGLHPDITREALQTFDKKMTEIFRHVLQIEHETDNNNKTLNFLKRLPYSKHGYGITALAPIAEVCQ